MAVFRFRQFDVEHDRSSMKVGTDAIVLGCLTPVEDAKHVLDIGTGCGILSMMAAQRNSGAQIEAIDIDKGSIEDAQYNFEHSKWKVRLNAYHQSLEDFAKDRESSFDFIISNPPFFVNSLQAQDKSRNQARHDVTLSFDELLRNSAKILTSDGMLCVILPIESFGIFSKAIVNNGLFLNRKTDIFSCPHHAAKRMVLEIGKQHKAFEQQQLTLFNHQNNITAEWLELCREFYLF